jgi:hypothetical protein
MGASTDHLFWFWQSCNSCTCQSPVFLAQRHILCLSRCCYLGRLYFSSNSIPETLLLVLQRHPIQWPNANPLCILLSVRHSWNLDMGSSTINPQSIPNSQSIPSSQSTPVTAMAAPAIRVIIPLIEGLQVFNHGSDKCFGCVIEVGFLAGSTPGTLAAY